MAAHKHEVLTSAVKRIVGGGSIAIEVCKCKAMRTVSTNKHGEVIASDWEVEEEETMPLIWDGKTHNDQEN